MPPTAEDKQKIKTNRNLSRNAFEGNILPCFFCNSPNSNKHNKEPYQIRNRDDREPFVIDK